MIGKEIGNYRILKELGKGGMGVVYKAHQLSLGRSVAMKVLPRHLTNDPSFIKRFHNEARAIAKLNHPNIVQIFDIGHEDDIHYYTMEFIEGPTLDDVVYKEGFLSPDRTLAIISQISKALRYAHSQGIVHRDIKPSNIMIAKSGRVKVTDFGLALQQRTTRLTVDGGIVGTPEYMPPEQAAGQTATAQSDIYSLGVVAYELLTGKVPFEGDSPLLILNKIQNSEPPLPRSINPDIPVDLENIVRKMMARDQDDRYKSCQEIIQDTQRIKSGQPVSLQPERSPALWRAGAGAAALALIAVVVYLIFWWPPLPTPIAPVLDIKVNGSEGPISLDPSSNVVLTISMTAGSYFGDPGELWISADTPSGMQWFVEGTRWVNSQTPVKYNSDGVIADCDFQIDMGSELSIGDYDFQFTVDNIINGSLDAIWQDPLNLTIVPMADPVPDVKVNGQDGPLSIGSGTPVMVTINLTAGDYLGQPGELWISADTPLGMQWFVEGTRWVNSETPVMYRSDGVIADCDFPIDMGSGLLIGNYDFQFTVDNVVNGSLDAIWQDPLNMTIKPMRVEEIRAALLILEGQMRDLKLNHMKGESVEKDFQRVKGGLSLIENRLKDFHSAMYPDELVLKSGGTIRGKVTGESIWKVRIETPLGPQQIPRDTIELTIYAEDEESQLAFVLLRIKERVDKLRRQVTSFQRILEPRPKEKPPEPPLGLEPPEDEFEEEPEEDIDDGEDDIIEEEPDEDLSDEFEEEPEEYTDDWEDDTIEEEPDEDLSDEADYADDEAEEEWK